jgi:hypothetical protein
MTDAPALEKTKILIVGHSHVAAPYAASVLRTKRGDDCQAEFCFVPLNKKIYQPLIVCNDELNGNLVAEIIFQKKRTLFSRCAITVGGSWHAVLGLCEHEARFSTVMTNSESSKNCYYLTDGLLTGTILSYAKQSLDAIDALSKILPKPVFFLQPPPPIEDNSYIASNASAYSVRVQKTGVADPIERLNIWRQYSNILKNHSQQCAVSFLECPASCVKKNGFLSERAWHVDPVHANAWYGEQVLKQLEDLTLER